MSAVVNFFEDIIDAVVDVVNGIIDVVTDLAETLWDAILEPVLEFVVGLFGITDEDVIQTQVSTQRIISTDVEASNLMTQIMLEEKKAPVGIMDRLQAHSQVVRNRYNKYFTYGEDKFVDGLPEANIRAIVVDEAAIKSIIDSVYGVNSTVLSSKLSYVTKEAFVGFWMQNNFAYRPKTNTLTYSGNTWQVDAIDYDYVNDWYDVFIGRYETRTTSVTTTTTITITNKDATTDYKQTVVTQRTLVVGSITGTVSDNTVVVGDVTIEIPKDSETGSTNSNTVDTIQTNVQFASAELQAPTFQAVRYYTVQYYTTDSSDWLWWVYKDGDGTYPTIDSLQKYVTNLEMMPIVAIRHHKVNVNSDKESARYKQSKDMLQYLGLDVDTLTDGIMASDSIDNVEDAFVHFGIDPKDTSKVISKSLFEMFDYMYSDSGLNTNGKFAATISEGWFNAALAWQSQSRVAVNGVIGPLGTYMHDIVDKNLRLRKQVAPKQYVELTLTNISSITFVEREELYGTVGKDVTADGFYVPLSIHFINKLNPLEQYELFNKSLLLSIYAAEVTHLEWYETEAFGDFLSIVGIALAVFTFGQSLWVNGTIQVTAATITAAVISLAVAVGAGMLLKLVLESTDSKFLKILAVLVYAYVMGEVAMNNVAPTASELLKSVTLYCSYITSISSGVSMENAIQMEALQTESTAYFSKIEEAQAQVDKAQEALDDGLDTSFYANLANMELKSPYVEGVDLMIHKAIQIQYEFGTLYDYDRAVGDFCSNKLRIGVV